MTSKDDTHALVVSDEFKAAVQSFKEDMYAFHQKISREETPQVDGDGTLIIRKRPDGYDYIVESYMRDRLTKHFPGWSLEMAAPLTFHGAEWVTAQVNLVVIDTGLLEHGIPYNLCRRSFYGVDSVRIQYRTEQKKNPDGSTTRVSLPHNPENLVDLGDNCKSVVTAAMKWSINRLLSIGDDVYGKRIEEEGMGAWADILESTGSMQAFNEMMKKHNIGWGEALKILGVESASDITDFPEAWVKIKGAKGIL